MKIVEFNEDIYEKIKKKKFCLVEKSILYLDELCDRFDILSNITAVVDENNRKRGVFLYKGVQITVYSLDYLKKLDSDEIILITSDYYREYVSKIEKLFSGQLKEIYVFYNYETKIELCYRNHYCNKMLENLIVFRSGPHHMEYVKGMDFADNARALFEYMISIKLNHQYELVWYVNDPKEYERYALYENVSFLAYSDAVSEEKAVRDEYYRTLCLAKYIFFTDAYGFARNCREDQIRVQLWHGCGFKMRLNGMACEKRYEYMTVTSHLYAKLHGDIFGLRKEQMLVTGCAKEDWLFQKDKLNILNNLEIPAAQIYIFWLPTYRFSGKDIEKPRDGELSEETGLPLISSREDLDLLNEILILHHIILVIKLHPFQDAHVIQCRDLSNIILIHNDLLAEKDIQVNELLCMADALISDYSSAAVDFLLLDRPMGFIVDDIEEYSSKRGFIFNNILEWLPGKCIFEKEDFIAFIEEIALGQDSHRQKRRQLRSRLHQYSDRNNCKRIVEALGICETIKTVD